MGGACGMHWRGEISAQGFGGKHEGKGPIGDRGVDGSMGLEWILGRISVLLYLRFLFISSYAFRTQEWFNLARDDVVRQRRTLTLVSFFGWLVFWLVGGVGWIRLAPDRSRWRAVVNAVMNLRVLAPRSYLFS
jgi:hypothetical protein